MAIIIPLGPLLLLVLLRLGDRHQRAKLGQGRRLVRRAAGDGYPERPDGGVVVAEGEGGAGGLVRLVGEASIVDITVAKIITNCGGGEIVLFLLLGIGRKSEKVGGVGVLGGGDGGVYVGHKRVRVGSGREGFHHVEHAPATAAAVTVAMAMAAGADFLGRH